MGPEIYHLSISQFVIAEHLQGRLSLSTTVCIVTFEFSRPAISNIVFKTVLYRMQKAF